MNNKKRLIPKVSGGTSIHKVKKGETLNSISKTFGVSIKDIINANNITNPDMINIEQELIIPVKQSTTSKSEQNSSKSNLKQSYRINPNKNWNTDQGWKYTYLDKNRENLDSVLLSVAHKRGLLNVLLNEGYATNQLNLKLAINPDSAVIARNPTKNPGQLSYSKLGNFGLDNIEDYYKAHNLDASELVKAKPFDNYMAVYGSDSLSLNLAAKIIDWKLNDGKKKLIKTYGKDNVYKFFKNNPGVEDKFLYHYYKMPENFKNRLKKYDTIEKMYQSYIDRKLNGVFKLVDNYIDVITAYFKDKY